MTTPQQGSSEKGSNKLQGQGRDESSKGGFREQGSNQEGGQLEQLMTFIKENWKQVLTELVTAGVTTYLAHGTKDKDSKTALKQ